jgi:hypothetical protein
MRNAIPAQGVMTIIIVETRVPAAKFRYPFTCGFQNFCVKWPDECYYQVAVVP